MKCFRTFGFAALCLASCFAHGQYTAHILNTTGFGTSINTGAISNGAAVATGVGTVGGGQPQAITWPNYSSAYTNLNPAGSSASDGYGIDGSNVVGDFAVGAAFHAIEWNTVANTFTDLHPGSSYSNSGAFAVSGIFAVGYANGTSGGQHFNHAILWNTSTSSFTDLNGSLAASVAGGVDGGFQVGAGTVGGNSHAGRWNGTAASFVDLNPAGWSVSLANDISGSNIVGYAQNGGTIHAYWWQGTSGSTDLNVSGLTGSQANAVRGTRAVGFGNGTLTGGVDHALLWNFGGGMIDLNGSFANSQGTGVDVQGDVLGMATDANGASHAVIWTPVPEPCSVAAFALGALALLRRRR